MLKDNDELKKEEELQVKLNDFVKENKEYMVTFFLLWGIACFLLMLFLEKGDEILFFAKERSSLLNSFFIFCTYIGEGYVYALAGMFFMFVAYSKSLAITINAMLVLGLSGALKNYFEHERPVRYYNNLLGQPDLPNYIPNLEIHDGWTTSFPSGHTTSAFAFYTLLAFFIPNKALKIACLLFAVLVGVSRIYLVQHFLKDVATGMLTGFFIALFVYWVHERFLYKINSKWQLPKRKTP